jgi:hypothetical protein
MLPSMRVVKLLGGLATLCLLFAAPAQATHPRPKSATVPRFTLVPAYSQCTAPDRTHGSPLAFPSCNPPAQTSAKATVGTPDANGAAVAFSGVMDFLVCVGIPGPPDDTDVQWKMTLNDVRGREERAGAANSSGPADYSGQLRAAFTLRQTDHFNATSAGGGIDPATIEDISFEATAACAETASTATGSTCRINSTFNAIIPGSAKDSKRVVAEMDDVRVYDGGADGIGDTMADNTVFLRQGIFVP